MRAIICDDEISTCAEIEQMLLQFAFEKCMKLEVDIFYSGDVLTQNLKYEKAQNILFFVF